MEPRSLNVPSKLTTTEQSPQSQDQYLPKQEGKASLYFLKSYPSCGKSLQDNTFPAVYTVFFFKYKHSHMNFL